MTVLRPIAARHTWIRSWRIHHGQRSAPLGHGRKADPQLGRGECMAGQARRRRGAGAAATLEGPDVLGLRPLVAADRGVLDALVVLQASVAVRLDRRVMHEYIRRSIVGDDKAVAFVRVEPFHCSLSHCDLLPERSSGSTSVHPGAARPPVPPWEGSGMRAPAVRIRRRCDTSTKFDYNRSHLTPSPALPLLDVDGGH